MELDRYRIQPVTGISDDRAHEMAVDLVEEVLEYNRAHRVRSSDEQDTALVESMKLEDHEIVALRKWAERQGLHRIT